MLSNNLLITLTVLVLLSTKSLSEYCGGSPAEGTRTNEAPIFDEEPTFVKSIKNAALYEAGPANARFPIVHVYGTPYEIGFAHGTLQKRYMKEFVDKTYAYFVGMAIDELSDKVSPEVQIMIILKGLNYALDWAAEVTAPFTPQEYYDELQGIADGSGIDYNTILRLNMFPELTKASCSFFGAWGTATAGHTYQLRALDYDTDGPFKDYPQITIYHPSDGNTFANMGWPGAIGILTGFNNKQIALSEIGVYFSDETFLQGANTQPTPYSPPEKVKGEPWMFVLRDILKYTDSIDAALEKIEKSERTCNLIIGVGDGQKGIVNGVQYSGYVANAYNDSTLLPKNDTWHPEIEAVVYNGMDWDCPNYDIVLGQQLAFYRGKIDEVVTIHDILPTVQTGNLHISVYDLTLSKMHVSFMRKTTANTSEPYYAYERQFTRLDMNSIFAIELPTVV
jgi:hypothetical protein